MGFDTLPFAIFLITTLFFWRFTRWPGLVLIAASVIFYHFAGHQDLAIVGVVLIANYLFSFVVARNKIWLFLIITTNVGCLALFKYHDMLFGGTVSGDFFTSEIIIPLGISFYIFQLIAYQVDIVRGHCLQQSHFLKFSLFVLFFPQLIAGPIVRSHQFMPQVERLFEGRKIRFSTPSFSLGLICLGVFKKVFIADSLAPIVDDIFAIGPSDPFTAWIGGWLFAFQIYFDFSGYSDMAIGMARLFGIRLPFNFRQPYLATNPRDFWQRWHITLSNWIRDYLYIPLGGSRKGRLARQILVMLFVMGLAGLWHGANSTFVIWGIAWALVIVFWRFITAYIKVPPLIGWVYTFLSAVLLFVIFRSPDMTYAANYFLTMFAGIGMGEATIAINLTEKLLITTGCGLLVSLHWVESLLFKHRIARALIKISGPLSWGILTGISTWMLIMPKIGLNPFIYFRF